MEKFYTRRGALGLLLLIATYPTFATEGGAKEVSNNLRFDGQLVADPCELDPTSAAITLDFGTVIDTYLYLHTRTHAQPFVIKLKECDLTLGNQVEVTFKGAESAELPGTLAVTSPADSGLAIGMSLPDGTPLSFNQTVPAFSLQSGTSELALEGYLIGEPGALANRTLRRGEFSALATFELNYP
ncbi:fimbrial protein [Lelliottia sp. WAP21]|uniref:fimbrial protein n=1 Tax=Lelliottia sp. WAP21 TaxID=2877426 RepID=UPI001E4A3F56|nr:fimbrial protein [Lelliottia sp. WAP21]